MQFNDIHMENEKNRKIYISQFIANFIKVIYKLKYKVYNNGKKMTMKLMFAAPDALT